MDQNSGEGFEGLVATTAFHRSRLMFLLMHFEVVLVHKIPLTLDTQVVHVDIVLSKYLSGLMVKVAV
jgi:hypothetical protein